MLFTGFAVAFDKEAPSGMAAPRIERAGQDLHVRAGPVRAHVRVLGPIAAEPELWPVRLDERFVFVCSGHVSNREDVASRLGEPRLSAESDTAIVWSAFQRWGGALSQVVLGEYSFAAVDRRERRIVAGTDTFAIGRLYYADSTRTAVVGTRLEYFRGLVSSDSDIDAEGLAGMVLDICFSPIRGRSAFRRVRMLRPGHALSGGAQPLREEQVWSPAEQVAVPSRAEERAEAFRELLSRAVGGALPRTGAAFVDVSGGLDSSAVACVASDWVKREGLAADRVLALRRMRSGVLDADPPELGDAVIEKTGFEAVCVDLEDYLSFSTELEFSLEPSFGAFYGAQRRRFSELVAGRGITAWLGGHGGDQVLGGGRPEPFYLRDILREDGLRQWLTAVSEHSRASRQWSVRKLLEVTLTSYPDRRPEPRPPWLTDAFFERLTAIGRERDSWPPTRTSGAATSWYYAVRSVQDPGTLPSCGLRYPLLFRPLVEFMFAAPISDRYTATGNRVLQRRALQGILPEAVRTRVGKASFGDVFFRGFARGWDRIKPLAAAEHLAQLGWVDPARFTAACERARHGVTSGDLHLLKCMLVLEGWMRDGMGSRHAGTWPDITATP